MRLRPHFRLLLFCSFKPHTHLTSAFELLGQGKNSSGLLLLSVARTRVFPEASPREIEGLVTKHIAHTLL
jgi:hypothetical protein